MTTSHQLARNLATSILGREPQSTSFDIAGSVFSSFPFAWDINLPEHTRHRPAFDALVDELAKEELDRLAAQDSARNIPLAAPTSCTRWQGKRWLLDHGYLPSQIEAMLTAIADPVTREAALTDWWDADTFQRDNVFVRQFAVQLGIALDTFFKEASQL